MLQWNLQMISATAQTPPLGVLHLRALSLGLSPPSLSMPSTPMIASMVFTGGWLGSLATVGAVAVSALVMPGIGGRQAPRHQPARSAVTAR